MLKRFCTFLIICSLLFGFIPYSIQSAKASTSKIDPSYFQEVKYSSQPQLLILQLKDMPVVPYSEKNQIHLQSTFYTENDSIVFDTSYGNILEKKQLDLFQTLQSQIPVELVHTYQYIYNGLAIRTAGYNISFLLNNSIIKTIFPAMEKNYLERWIGTKTIHAQDVWYMKNNKGNFLTGQGTRIGIIDTGIAYNHIDFTPIGVGPDSKIKGGFDFADNDNDFIDAGFKGKQPPHGTHVAGIASGRNPNNDEKVGVTPESDLYIYKVFSDEGGGANLANIIKAAEQAVIDKCDVINLSLGHSTDGSSDDSGNPYYDALLNVDKAGTMVVAAAGNAGTRHKKNPWPIDAPGVFDFALQVSASDDRLHQSFVFRPTNGYKLSTNAYKARHAPTFPTNPDLYSNIKLIDCGFGGEDEFPSSVKGNIAFISRGPKNNGLTFQLKNLNAKKAGALGCIIYNYDPEQFGGTLVQQDEKPEDFEFIPCIFISGVKATEIKKHLDQDYQIFFPIGSDFSFSDFSSTGPSYSADENILKPEICAPGKMINSSYLHDGYIDMDGSDGEFPPFNFDDNNPFPGFTTDLDGTSMATPFVAGCVALTRQAHPKWKSQSIKNIFMHSSDLLKNFVNGQYISYFLQGSGQINVQNAITSPIEINPPYIMRNKEQFDQPITISIKNIIDQDVTLSLSAEIFDCVLTQLDLEDLPIPEKPVSLKLSNDKITIKPGETTKIQLSIQEKEDAFINNKYEGAFWIDIQNASAVGSSTSQHHLPIIVWKDTLRDIPPSISDFYFSKDTLNMDQSESGYVHFNLNAGSILEIDMGSPDDGKQYNNIANYLSFHAYDQTGVDWGTVKTFEYLPLGEYVFEWDGKSLEGNEFLPDGDFYLSASIQGTLYTPQPETIYETISSKSILKISGSSVPKPPTFLITSPKKVNIGDKFVVNLGFREPFDIQEFEVELKFSRSKLDHGDFHIGNFVDLSRLTDRDYEFDRGVFFIRGYRNPNWDSNGNAIIAQIEFEAKRATDTLDVEIINFEFKDSEGLKRKTLFLFPTFLIEKDNITLGDFNEDGLIDDQDFILLQDHYYTNWKDKEKWDPIYDLNSDYYVNLDDLKIFARYYSGT